MMNVENELNNTVNNTHFEFNDFIYSGLFRYNLFNQPANGEKRGQTAVFTGKGTMKTVMRDINNLHRGMCTVMITLSLII